MCLSVFFLLFRTSALSQLGFFFHKLDVIKFVVLNLIRTCIRWSSLPRKNVALTLYQSRNGLCMCVWYLPLSYLHVETVPLSCNGPILVYFCAFPSTEADNPCTVKYSVLSFFPFFPNLLWDILFLNTSHCFDIFVDLDIELFESL